MAHMLLEALQEARADLVHEMMMASQHRQVFVQDMSEVLMLDMGGNGAYGQGSPGEAARFSFSEHSSHTVPADASDAAWQIAEVALAEQSSCREHGAPVGACQSSILYPLTEVALQSAALLHSMLHASLAEQLVVRFDLRVSSWYIIAVACTDIFAFCDGSLEAQATLRFVQVSDRRSAYQTYARAENIYSCICRLEL